MIPPFSKMKGRCPGMGIFLACLFVFMSPGWGQETGSGFEKYRLLLQRQPFLPSGIKQPGPADVAGKNSTLSFTGFVISGDKVMIGIEDKAQNKSYLLTEGQVEEGISLAEVHLDQKYVTVQANGQVMRLDLASPEIAGAAPIQVVPSYPGMQPMQVPFPGMPSSPMMQPGQMPLIPPILNPSPNQNPIAPGTQPETQPRRRIIIPRRN